MSLKDYFIEKQRMIERKKRLESAKKLGTGLTIGALIGSAAGVLFAPKSGEETRRDISDAALKANEQLKEKSKELSNEVVKKYNETKESLIDYKESKLTNLKAVEDDVEELVIDKKNDAKELAEEAKDIKDDLVQDSKELKDDLIKDSKDFKNDIKQDTKSFADKTKNNFNKNTK